MQVRTLVGVILSLAIASGGTARAHFGERTDSFWGFVSRSDAVMIGTVLGSQRFEEKGHTPVAGAVRLRVDEVLSGEAPTGELGILIQGMHQPAYREDEQVLVFAERRGEVWRSLQTRGEKIRVDGRTDPEITAVRRYVEIAAAADTSRRLRQLRDFTIALLESSVPRLHQDAVFDLSRKGLLDPLLGDSETRALGEIAIRESSPLIVREGIVAKLGVLMRTGRDAAYVPLRWLAVETTNPAVRVAALHALGTDGDARALPALLASIDAKNFHVRRAAVEGLGGFQDLVAIDALRRLGRDSDARIRFAAMRALERVAPPETRDAPDPGRKGASSEEHEHIAQTRDLHTHSTAASKGKTR